jgi:hypothetical protein
LAVFDKTKSLKYNNITILKFSFNPTKKYQTLNFWDVRNLQHFPVPNVNFIRSGAWESGRYSRPCKDLPSSRQTAQSERASEKGGIAPIPPVMECTSLQLNWVGVAVQLS